MLGLLVPTHQTWKLVPVTRYAVGMVLIEDFKLTIN